MNPPNLTDLMGWGRFAEEEKTLLEVLTILNNRHLDIVKHLERERDQLARWKDDQMFVESQWDAQAVGKELGMVAGTDIRRNILPRVAQLKKERDEFFEWVAEKEAQIQDMRETMKEACQALTICATDEDALGVDDTPTSSGIHMTPEQREPLLSDFRVRCLVAARAALTKLKPFLP